jgi:hypothetical protein
MGKKRNLRSEENPILEENMSPVSQNKKAK